MSTYPKAWFLNATVVTMQMIILIVVQRGSVMDTDLGAHN